MGGGHGEGDPFVVEDGRLVGGRCRPPAPLAALLAAQLTPRRRQAELRASLRGRRGDELDGAA